MSIEKLFMQQRYRMGNDYGYIMWDIVPMLEDREQFNIKEFSVSELIADNPFHGNVEYAMGTDITIPLIVVNLRDGVDKLIDGNHRLYKAQSLGQEKIKAYYLSCEVHQKYIVDFEENAYWNVVKHWQG